MFEHCSKCFTARLEATSTNGFVYFLQHGAVDLEHAQEWSYEPNMVEGRFCELACPLGSYADAEKQSAYFVSQTKPARETRV